MAFLGGLAVIILAVVLVNPLPKLIRYQINNRVADLDIDGAELNYVENKWIDNTPVRLYKDTEDPGSVIYYVPGGSFIASNLESHDNICRYLAKQLDAQVISINYRKAPEHKFPAGYSDTEKVLKWILSDILGEKKLFLVGDGVGANLMAGLSHKFNKEIAAQVMINPVLDLRAEAAAYQNYDMFIDWYLEKKDDALDPKASPILLQDLSDLPETLVITCSEDALKVDGEAYHQKLLDAGVSSHLKDFENFGHLTNTWSGATDETQEIRAYVVEKLQKEINKVFTSEALKIRRVGNNTYVHVSYLNDDTFGKVACNGMVVSNEDETIIYDTPADSLASRQLIAWIRDELKSKINLIIPTHFHYDCLGTLDLFHEEKVPSMANNLTIELARSRYNMLPQQGFDKYYSHQIGKEVVISDFIGSGHTKDNIVGYYQKDNVLFGGCLVKSLGAGKGNLNDAVLEDWSNTIHSIQEKYPDINVVIPGHGAVGGPELLDYTAGMFRRKE